LYLPQSGGQPPLRSVLIFNYSNIMLLGNLNDSLVRIFLWFVIKMVFCG
jgi:hypothetical protein